MESFRRWVLGLSALCVSGQLLAEQIPGYQVDWSTGHAVPLSPWVAVVLALMLAGAAYGFLRARAGRALTLLFGAVLVGGLGLYAQDAPAPPVATDTIATPSGSMILYCTVPRALNTTVSGGIDLTVTPINGAPPPGPFECATGMHLDAGHLCKLCPTT